MGQYKMKHQGVPALMKALVGDQHKLPEHLKEAIKNAPAKKEDQSKYGKKHDRLRKKAGKLEDKAMNYPGQKPVSDKKADKLFERSRKLKDKAKNIRNAKEGTSPVRKEENGKKIERLKKRVKKIDNKLFATDETGRLKSSEKKQERLLNRGERVRNRARKEFNKNS